MSLIRTKIVFFPFDSNQRSATKTLMNFQTQKEITYHFAITLNNVLIETY